MNNTLTMKLFSAALAACVSTVSFAEITHAKTVEFAYSPTELENAEQLDERVRKFAKINCRNASPLIPVRVERECRDEIVAQLRAKIWGE
jgi:UrcA family protein